MKHSISQILFTCLLFTSVTVIAQTNNTPPDHFRTATSKETLLHDNAYTVLQHQIESNICDNNWSIALIPFLININPDEKIVIINDPKGYENIPVFTREQETFKISMKQESSLYQANLDETKKQTDAFTARNSNISSADKKELAIIKKQNDQYSKNMSHLSNSVNYGSISLELNQSWADDKKTSAHNFVGNMIKPVTVAGIQQGVLSIEFPDKDNADTTYLASLYIGNWPKLSDTKMLPFHFIKNNSGEPIIENMKIEISTFGYNKMMKIINGIDWKKMQALVKE